MDTVQVALVADAGRIAADAWYIVLVKLVIFSVCVTAVVEACKHFLAAFVKKATYDRLATADRIRSFTFFVALGLAWSIDYGILYKAVEPGIRSAGRDTIGVWADYVVTASICMMGARWAYEKVSTSLAQMKELKDNAEAGRTPSEQPQGEKP